MIEDNHLHIVEKGMVQEYRPVIHRILMPQL